MLFKQLFFGNMKHLDLAIVIIKKIAPGECLWDRCASTQSLQPHGCHGVGCSTGATLMAPVEGEWSGKGRKFFNMKKVHLCQKIPSFFGVRFHQMMKKLKFCARKVFTKVFQLRFWVTYSKA